MNKEIRYCHIRAEQREDDNENRTVTGYAIRFNEDSQILHESGRTFIERIDPTAITTDLINKSDVYALLNHDEGRGMLARSKNGQGSLRLEVDEQGVRFTFDAPHTALGDEVVEGIRRGDIDACSFAFCTTNDTWDYEGETAIRTIRSIDALFDISVVYNPAYPTTSVNVRMLDKQVEEPVNESVIDLDKYYVTLKSNLY